ncbi:UvrD-helicase domain-containing protein [Nostoc punctiforme UO1]|uniref:UvrD-helicase domain-containing protein n=1 Tax=Nostoc punctiforme TaxID=272131 RepID=UPI0030A1ACAC
MKLIENDFQIDTVQIFNAIIGNNTNFWELLVGKVVSRFNETVHYIIQDPEKKEIKREKYAHGKVHPITFSRSSKLLIEIDYGKIFLVRYTKQSFLREFNKINQPLSYKKVNEILKKAGKEKTLEEVLNSINKSVKENNLVSSLKEEFKYDFLNSYKFYQTKCSGNISFGKYKYEKLDYVSVWIEKYFEFSPDFEQAAAIGAVENHVQVVARAGSGKTSTIVNRALFLQKHCGIAPHEILLLAFNGKAVEEIKDRLCSKLESFIPHVMTFHALAYALVHPEKSILFDEPDGQQSKSRMLQKLIDEYLQDTFFCEKIQALMMAHFRQDWERLILGGYDKSPEEMLRYRRSLPREGIDGTYIKSYGEKVIADFLFEHNVQYKYEQNFWWGGINYRPDFTISTGKSQGIIIEYFGLEGDSEYDAMSDEKRKYWENQPDWHLIELTPSIIKDEGIGYFIHVLQQELEYLGITCDRLSEEEIWQRVKVRAIDRFTKVITSFIQRCRKLSLTPENLTLIINTHSCASEAEQQFLELGQKFYKSYLERLELTGEDDFDGMIQKAAVCVKSGQTTFRRKSGSGDLKSVRYILIDEYQDFSELFYQLISAIREQNTQAMFFCVGDDWQAINGFAGSDLRFYDNFARFFEPSQKLYISTNYRSATSIVDIGNKLKQGLGTPARADKNQLGRVEIADLARFEPTLRELEGHQSDSLTPAILRLVNKAIKADKSVVLLCRKNSLPWHINYRKGKFKSENGILKSFLQLVQSYLPQELRDKVTISTSHKYKGLEKDVVIILDAVPNCYPLIHPDLIFTRVFGDSTEKTINEERRLFYVALTRAVDNLFIITETDNFSPFLEELKEKTKIPFLNWSDYPPIVETIKHITVKVGNQHGKGESGTYLIKHLFHDEGYSWKSKEKFWFRIYPIEEFSIQKYFDNATWVFRAVGIEARFYDDLENKLAVYHVDRGICNPVFDRIPKFA